MDQKRFDKRMWRHERWLKSRRGGRQLQVGKEELQGAVATYRNLNVSEFDGADMRDADLSGSRMLCGEILRSNFRGATLENTNLSYGIILDSCFVGASLRRATFSSTRLVNVDFTQANLSGVTFEDARFHDVVLTDARLSWNSRDLLAEVLWQAAEDDAQQQLAAFVARKTAWCWDNWCKLDHPCKEWAFKTLAARVRPEDDAPRCVQLVAEGWEVEDALAERERNR